MPYLSGNGGTETVIKNFYEAMTENHESKNWKWKLVSFGGSENSFWMSAWPKKVYSFPNNRLFQYICYIILLPILIPNILRKEKPDVFIATNPIMWTIAYKVKKIYNCNTKIIAWYHYSFKKKNVKKIYLNNVDIFWAISNGIKNELISMGVNPNKIKVVFNPINTKNSSVIKRSGARNHFIYVGRIDYDGQKNVSELIRGLSRVDGQWSCDLYGTIASDTFNKLEKLKSELGISNKIVFHGFSKNVWSKIKEADVILLTSKYEGLPMVLCEAASCGISLIASNCPTGVADIINKNNGYLYKPGDVSQLSRILNAIISGKKVLPDVKQVRDSIQKFNYEAYCNRIIESLKDSN